MGSRPPHINIPRLQRYMSNMRDPSKFARAAQVAMTTMFVLYVVIACVAYAMLGKAIDPELPLTSLLPRVMPINEPRDLAVHPVVIYL